MNSRTASRGIRGRPRLLRCTAQNNLEAHNCAPSMPASLLTIRCKGIFLQSQR